MRGQLQGINEAYAQTAYTGGVSKTFGEALRYDYGFTKNRYDGKLAGVIWRGTAPYLHFAYGYDYHQHQALKNAAFSYWNPTLSNTWENSALDYSVSNLSYDKNGNIKSMDQKGIDPPGGVADIDILNYTYKNGDWSNQLDKVSDGGQDVPGAGDFKQNNVNDGNAYTYDANGNLVYDAYKGLGTATYTFFDKPLRITMDNGEIEYAYDAAGSKAAELIRDDANGTVKLTEYIGNFVYVDNKLRYILTAEGRTVFDDQAAMPVREEYFVKDHLGNVRSTINVSTYSVTGYLGTFEMASANLENLMFDKLDEVREYKPGGGGDNTMAALLDGADEKRRVGASLLVHVMAGDRVTMNVNNYYQNYNPNDDAPVGEKEVLASLTGALTSGAGGFGGSESHDTKMVEQLFSPDRFSTASDIVGEFYTDASKPRAYLNYVLFNERMEVVSEMTGAFQANGADNWTQIGTTGALEVPVNGYLAMYLSNASVRNSTGTGQQVFFDQMQFTVSKGNLLEESHYYPFGLPMYGMGSTDPGMQEQGRKYQGNEYIQELGLHWMDFNNRQYDPQLGRFLSIDPLAAFGGQDMYSPYAAMGNMPEALTDPNGLMPGLDKAQFIGGGPAETGDMNRIRNLSVGGAGGGGGIFTMSGINLDPNNLFNTEASFSAAVKEMLQNQFIQGLWGTVRSSASGTVITNFDGQFVSSDVGGTGLGSLNGILAPGARMLSFDGKNATYDNGEGIGGEFKGAVTGRATILTIAGSFGGNTEEANWYGPGGQYNWYLGTFGTLLENVPGSFRLRTTKLGFSPKYYPNAWGGNQYAKTFKIGKVAKGFGYLSAGIGLALDLYGMYKYSKDPNSPNAVSPAKAGLNTAMTANALWVNPIAGIVYFGMDAFYPGGWGNGSESGFLYDQKMIQFELDKVSRAGPYNIRLVPWGPK